ncbi:hypothetical protein AGMMS49982_17580 [Bacteroidia bacterium]|nr:hypothetical protein AGMMS49982_17580 [Bacteroidia bacterium]
MRINYLFVLLQKNKDEDEETDIYNEYAIVSFCPVFAGESYSGCKEANSNGANRAVETSHRAL